jgi:hypothetical protein
MRVGRRGSFPDGAAVEILRQGTHWRWFELPGEAPFDRLLRIPAWKLLLDSEGAALFARAMVHQQPRVVQRSDLLQLVYLGASGMRILASADQPFIDMAQQIVHGRYPGGLLIRPLLP